MISATDIRAGMIIVYNGELHRAHSVLHKTPGNLRGFVQAKLRNLKSGAMNEHRFRSEDKVEKASLDTHQMQYLYSDGQGHHFMNQETFDQIRLDDEVVGESMKYLLPETVIEIDFYDGNPVSVELPTTVNLRIVEVEATPRPSCPRCQAIVAGPASRPSATSSVRSVTMRARTASANW